MATAAAMAGTDFDLLPYDEGRKWELIDGEMVPVSSPTPEHQLILSYLNASLREYFRLSSVGAGEGAGVGAAIPDVEFSLSENDRVRPDLSVLLHARWKSLDLRRVPVPGSPNIAVEIISPSERAAESTRKVWVYLRAEVEEVWQIYPKSASISIYRATGPVQVLTDKQTLTSPLLPGWAIALEELFPF